MADVRSDRTRLAIKKLVALAHWCEKHDRPWPKTRDIADAMGISWGMTAYYLQFLLREQILIDHGRVGQHRIIRINDWTIYEKNQT